MKAYTSRNRFDETRRFSFVGEEMGRARLDSDANEQAWIARTDARRRSEDLAEGSPDDGFLVTDLHLLDPVLGLSGWSVVGLPPEDLRDIRMELTLARRDPESLPYVTRARGATSLRRDFPTPIDLLRRPIPLDPEGRTFQAAEMVLQLRFERPPTDDEIVDIRLAFLDENGTAREVAGIDPGVVAGEWRQLRVPLADFAAFPRSPQPDGGPGLLVRGWTLLGLPPRAEIFVDALLVVDDGLPESDFILRGGDGTVTGAGRLFVEGRRTFLETDWRYSLQPGLPNPQPLSRPDDLSERHLVYVDIFDRPVHAFEDDFLVEPALAGEPTTFRGVKTTQIRVMSLPDGAPPLPPAPMGAGRITTAVPDGELPDRFPPEDPDPCRDRCLFSENVSTGEGYRGKINAHMRVEILHGGEGLAAPVIAWARDNAATVAPLIEDASADAVSVVVEPEDAGRLSVDDIVVLEDAWTRLDPGRDGHRPVLRRLRAVDTATGRLEFFPNALPLTEDPEPLNVGGPTGRAFLLSRHAAVRRWDGADWLLTDTRYNLRDGIDFAFSGSDFRAGEYWNFTARIVDPDGGARGVVERLVEDRVHGPDRVRAPIGLIEWTAEGRSFVDLRERFLPLHEVRDRLIELGARHLSPGAFTVVVGDGVRTFGDVDQNIAEGVTGDEAIQTALARLGEDGGTIYVRAGTYVLEHPVILQNRNAVRILGDGAATRLSVTGAGGAFHLDSCGVGGAVGLELLALEETPSVDTPFGSVPPVDVAVFGSGSSGGPGDVRPLTPDDLGVAPGGPDGLIARLGEQLRTLPPRFGRIGASIVRTLQRLRRLQRENPGVPLEESAPDELRVLQGLPHGVVTLCDCRNVTLRRLEILSRAVSGNDGSVSSGILVTGGCSEITIDDNAMRAPSGVVALPYARYLSASALIAFPHAALFVRDLRISGNRMRPDGVGREGLRIADGILDGLAITGNRVESFPVGIAVEDRAEYRPAGVDRLVIRDNQLVEIGKVGLSIDGDGVDVESNEVRLAAALPPAGNDEDTVMLRAGIWVTGTGVRLRDCWIALPASLTGRNPFTLEAAVLVGAGVVAGRSLERPAPRPVSDLEIIDTRIEGAGAATLADGIAIAGPQPVFDVRISRNMIRSLGGAGIRAMGYAAPIGGLHVTDNRIENVARATLAWGAAAVRALQALDDRLSGLNANATGPRDALDRLLTLDPPAETGLDAVLRWLDVATLRGAIVLSLAEESSVASNAVQGIGTRDMPPGFVDPGAPLQTAGILALGGSDVRVGDNAIEDVTGVVQPIIFNPPPIPGPARPPIIDLLDRYRLQPLIGPGAQLFAASDDVHASLGGLRRRVAELVLAPGEQFAAGRAGLRLGVEAVLPHMRATGGELAVAADRIAEASELIVTSASDSEARIGADALRAAVSDAAGITAPDSDSIAIWSVVGAFDRSTLGNATAVAEQAGILAESIEKLPDAVREISPDAAELARAVANAPGDAELQRRLAAETGRLVTAVTVNAAATPRIPIPQRDTGGQVLSSRNIRAVQNLSRSLSESLTVRRGTTLSARLESSESAMLSLIDTLGDTHPERAGRLRTAFADLREGRIRLTRARIDALRVLTEREVAAALEELRDGAGGGAPGAPPAAGPNTFTLRTDGNFGERVEQRIRAESIGLLSLAARSVDVRLADAAAVDPLDETFELKLTQEASRQLLSLTEGEDKLQETAKAAIEAVEKALSAADRNERESFRESARFSLDALATAGRQDGSAAPAPQTIAPDRLAALGQLTLEIGGIEEVELRRQAIDHFESNVERINRALSASPQTIETARARIGEARKTLGSSDPSDVSQAAAIATLASVAETVSREAGQAPGAAPETATVVLLTELGRGALDPDRTEAERLAAVRDRVAVATAILSPTLRADIAGAGTIADVLVSLRGGMSGITRLPPMIIIPPPVITGFRAHPADGIYCAAVAERLSLADNRIDRTRIGVTIAGAEDHPLAPPDPAGAVIDVRRNVVARAPIAAFDLRPGGQVALAVTDNAASACAGAPDPDATAYGQGVLVIVGSGELTIAGNSLRDNGNNAAVGLLHEILADWRGDATVRGNRVRHAGGARGGAGILLLTGAIDAAMVARLSREPALVVEPAPSLPPKSPPSAPWQWLGGLINPSLFAYSLASGPAMTPTDGFDFGTFKLADAATPTVHAVFAAGPRPAPSTEPARVAAQAWLAAPAPAPVASIVAFLDRLPAMVLLPPPPARRSVQIVSNDVTASGPALLLLHDGSALISAGVTGNEFESSEQSGAVYLRGLDQVVFTGNRCEALREVNVAVLRCGDAAVTASANGVVGREPATPPQNPLPKPSRGVADQVATDSLSLKLDLGDGAGLSIPVRAEALMDSLRGAGGTGVYGVASERAEAGFKVYAAQRAIDPATRILGSGGINSVLRLAEANAGSTTSELRINVAPSDPEAILSDILADPALPDMSKLYAAAKFVQFSDSQARGLVARQLEEAEGDAAVALSGGINILAGDVGGAEGDIVAGVAPRSVFENMLGLALKDRRPEFLFDPGRFTPVPPTPPPRDEPRDRSLVIIGGARVAAVGNATTAGVYVHPGPDRVLLNV